MDQPKPRLTPGKGPAPKAAPLEEPEYIPTHERIKLEPLDVSEEDILEARSQDKLAWIMLAAILVIGAVIGISVAMAPPAVDEEQEQVANAEEQSEDAGAADSAAAGDTTSSSSQSAPTPPEPPKPAPKTPPAATAATTTPAAPVTPPTPFGIVVGSYLNEERAQEEATKLKGATTLEAKVESFDDGGVPSFRVVLGSFPTKAAAQKKANDLIGQDLVYEARVAPLK